jgi:hypothetical protein
MASANVEGPGGSLGLSPADLDWSAAQEDELCQILHAIENGPKRSRPGSEDGADAALLAGNGIGGSVTLEEYTGALNRLAASLPVPGRDDDVDTDLATAQLACDLPLGSGDASEQAFTNSSGWLERNAPAVMPAASQSGSVSSTPAVLDAHGQAQSVWTASVAEVQARYAPAVIHGGKPDCCPVCGDSDALQRARGYIQAREVQLGEYRGGRVVVCAFCGPRQFCRSPSSSSDRTNGSGAALQ